MFYAWNVRWGFPLLSYSISAEVHFNFIHYLFTWMSCEHTTFYLVFMKIPKWKRLRWQTKEVVVNVYDYISTGIDISEWITNTTTIYKQTGTIEQWHTYLHWMMKNHQQNKLVIYLDETFFVKRFFQNCSGFRAALNHKRQYLIIILIIIIIIREHMFI